MKSNILLFCTVFASLFIIAASFIIGAVFLPKTVTYTAVQETVADSSEGHGTSCLYSRIFDIKEKGPFYINREGDSMYVCSDGKYLYRINAPVSHLSGSDESSVLSGIEIKDKMSLYEIIEYIES